MEEAYAGTHIAIVVRWCIERDLLAEENLSDQGQINAASQVMQGSLAANEYFEKYFDWKFGEWNLKPAAAEFMNSYYDQYLDDIAVEQPNAIYGPESAVDWNAAFELLDRKRTEYLESCAKDVSQAKNKWWKFW